MTRLVLIAAAALDWPNLLLRLGAGTLPHLAGLRLRGMAGWVAGSPTGDGPAAWAALATGEPPDVHRIYAPQEAWAGGLRAVGRSSWGAAPAWARLAAAGVSTASIAWPASRPGADWVGVHLDDTFAEASGPDRADWALPLRCAPAEVRDAIRDRRVHPADISAAMLAPLVPGLAQIDQTRDAGLPMLAQAMAQAATIQAGAAWMLETDPPEAVFIHHPWMARVRAHFDHLQDGPFAQAVDGAWRFLDGLVGGLVDLAGCEANVMLVSPGWRNTPGVVLAAGPSMTSESQIEGIDLLDVVPTVLARFGLEDPDLLGRPFALLGGAEGRRLAPRPRSPPQTPPDPVLLRAAAEAGFPTPPPPTPQWHAENLAALALLVLARDPGVARDVSAQALTHDPANVTALRVSAMAHVALESAEPLPALADALDRVAPNRGWGALARGAHHVLKGEIGLASPWLTKAEADPDLETLLRVAAVWLAAARPMNAERVFRAILARDPGHASAEIGLSMVALARLDFIAAEAALRRALSQDPGRSAAYLGLAQVYTRTGRRADAAQFAATAVRLGADRQAADAACEGRA